MFVPYLMLVVVSIYQVTAAPLEKRIESDGSYKRLYVPYIQSVDKAGKVTILSEKDLLGLNAKLESGGIPADTQFQLIGLNGFKRELSDHHIRRIARQEIAAIVNPADLDKPGFGHLFMTMNKFGEFQTFIYNLSLAEANEKMKTEGFPGSASGDSYHHNPKSVNSVSKA